MVIGATDAYKFGSYLGQQQKPAYANYVEKNPPLINNEEYFTTPVAPSRPVYAANLGKTLPTIGKNGYDIKSALNPEPTLEHPEYRKDGLGENTYFLA